ncbi:beta-1,4-galactosyltransferase 4-like isoform X1 [Salarias fasciatus]|uniref:Beta-1,4-galactosyltransferase n=1 Tax=Salarias fasciatus TaxID=181472 RepID=A0A672H3P6_SALFA|nr:beta-1,4-galactosyltransferase 4-like isoform X1 [Salarias fasciatus]
MELCSSACNISHRAKYFVLLVLSLSVVAWIIIFPGDTVTSLISFNSTHTPVKEDGLGDKLHSTTEEDFKEDGLGDKLHSTTEASNLTTPPQKVDCPKVSPLLQGLRNLSFDSSLTLNDVVTENENVRAGEYEPPDCAARQSVAILIPFRNRERHLVYLLHHLHPFLQRQQLHYAIYVIHQAGNATFNRAKLLNIGYLEALKDYNWDCFIFHDVDLVPEDDRNLYVCAETPKHMAGGRNTTGYKMSYPRYFGGVTALTRKQFVQVNGFSNSYWGWGCEDDDLYVRFQLQKVTIVRPPIAIARYSMVFHTRDKGNEKNKDRFKLLKKTQEVWMKDGLNSCSYKTLSMDRLPLYVNITVDIGKP